MEHWKDSLQASHLHLQPDLCLICISMIYKKNVLLNFLLENFGGSRSAKHHVRQNLVLISNFANFPFLPSAYFIQYEDW